jgi:site-specific recombinase XerD
VPLGKLKTERWVPVDSMVCQLVERIRSLRPLDAPTAGRLLLARPRGRTVLVRRVRAALQEAVAAVGITARIVPHQFRHTYGTEMLRAGVGFAGVWSFYIFSGGGSANELCFRDFDLEFLQECGLFGHFLA